MTDEIVGDEPCPSCRAMGRDRTGNHLIVFSNGNKYCNRCQYKEINDQEEPDYMRPEEIDTLSAADLPDRRLWKDTLEKYGVKVGFNTTNGEVDRHFYPSYKDGSLQGYKVRILPKQFMAAGSIKQADLFGQNICGDGGRMVVVTEGELDALAASQMFRMEQKNYKAVSLPDGASMAALERNMEWLEKFDTIVFAFDQDKAGKELVDLAIPKFTPGKVKVMHFDEKDPSDMLVKNKSKDFLQALYNAKSKRPDGIVSGAETWERLMNRPEIKSIPYPDGWDSLNEKTYGIRLGELDTWTSGSGY